MSSNQDANGTEAFYNRLKLSDPSRMIRVLDVEPSSPDAAPNDPLRGTLRVIDIHTDQNYVALSYVCGAFAPDRHGVICNGHRLDITSNCHAALRHLTAKLGRISIWVDSVSINQADLHEKSLQIGLMGDIYTRATIVYVWLGKGSARQELAFSYLSSTGSDKYLHQGESDIVKNVAKKLHSDPGNPTLHPNLCLSLRGTEQWEGHDITNDVATKDLESLLGCQYVRRVWTYQEILLCRRPVVVYGHTHIPWDRLATNLLLVSLTHTSQLQDHLALWLGLARERGRLQFQAGMEVKGTDSLTFPKLDELCQKIFEARKSNHSMTIRHRIALGLLIVPFVGAGAVVISISNKPAGTMLILISLLFPYAAICGLGRQGKGRPLMARGVALRSLPPTSAEDLIHGLYGRNANDPKDKAFGIGSVLKKKGLTNVQTPDYGRHIDEVYQRLTVDIAEVTKSPNVLLLAAAQGIPGRPTWVPDWSAGQRHTWLSSPGARGTDRLGLSVKSDELLAKIRSEEVLQHMVLHGRARQTLTTRAWNIGSIAGHVMFHEIDDIRIPTSSDGAKHLANLRAMYRCLEWSSNIAFHMSSVLADTPTYRRENPSRLRAWAACLSFHSRTQLESAYARWLHDPHEQPKWFKAFRETQVALCNHLARSDRKICLATLKVFPGQPYLTACRKQVEIGDSVLRIVGLPQPLVVRERHGVRTKVGLVSPMYITTEPSWQRPSEEVMASNRYPQSECEEFEIY